MNDIKHSENEARQRFILRRGVLGYGFSTGFIFVLGFSWWWDYPLLITVPGAVLFALVGGYFWGALMWKREARSHH